MNIDPPLVYRAYDAAGRLLYVGTTRNLGSRLQTHNTQSWWFGLVDRITTEVYGDTTSAKAAEASAIRAEGPVANVQYTGRYDDCSRVTDEDLRFIEQWCDDVEPFGLTRLPQALRRRVVLEARRRAATP